MTDSIIKINLFLKESIIYLESLKLIYRSHKNMLLPDFIDKVKVIDKYLYKRYNPNNVYNADTYLVFIDDGYEFIYTVTNYRNTIAAISPYLCNGDWTKSSILIKCLSKNTHQIMVESGKLYYPKDKSFNNFKNSSISLVPQFIINNNLQIIKYFKINISITLFNYDKLFDDLFKFLDSQKLLLLIK